MNKKIISLLIALILMLSVSTIAFAKTTSEDDDTLGTTAEDVESLKEQLSDANSQISQLQTTKLPSLSPNVLIQSYNYGGDSIDGAKPFALSYVLKNTSSNITIQNIIVKVDGGEAFKIANGTNSSYVNAISPNGTVSQSIELSSGLNVESGVYPVNIGVSFEYFDNGEKGSGTAELSISIPVSQKDKFAFNDVKLADTAYVDKEQNVNFKLVNTGYTTLKNCTISILDNTGNVVASSFYGAVEPSSQIDDGGKLAITPTSKGEHTYVLKIEYEDKYANIKEMTKEFSFKAKIYENPFESESQDNIVEDDNVKKTSPVAIIIPIVIVVALVAIVIIVVKKKKSKKQDDDFDDDEI